MQSQEVKIKPNVKVVMKSDAEQLDEVVVTAMGIKRSEKALGYAATSVGGEKISQSRSSDVMSALAGKVAGVQISATSSDPGASNSVIIRGVSSLSGSNQPLYVIDGVPLNNDSESSSDGLNSGFDFGNGANAVNPDDVASMTILKGAAATALYGSRAANGVVMITTKTGQKGKGLKCRMSSDKVGVVTIQPWKMDLGVLVLTALCKLGVMYITILRKLSLMFRMKIM